MNHRYVFTPNILNVTVSYVPPYGLANFFITNNISLCTGFKYDASLWCMQKYDVSALLNIFPHISFVGLYISYSNIMPQFEFKFIEAVWKKLRHFKVKGDNGGYVEKTRFHSDVFNLCENIISFSIENLIIQDMYNLVKCSKLKMIEIGCGTHMSNLNFLCIPPMLRHVRILGYVLSHYELEILSTCLGLRRLETRYQLFYKFNFPNLRRLKIMKHAMSHNQTVKMSFFNGCPKLRVLDISDTKYMMYVDIVPKKLRKLDLTNCVILNDNTCHIDWGKCKLVGFTNL